MTAGRRGALIGLAFVATIVLSGALPAWPVLGWRAALATMLVRSIVVDGVFVWFAVWFDRRLLWSVAGPIVGTEALFWWAIRKEAAARF